MMGFPVSIQCFSNHTPSASEVHALVLRSAVEAHAIVRSAVEAHAIVFEPLRLNCLSALLHLPVVFGAVFDHVATVTTV